MHSSCNQKKFQNAFCEFMCKSTDELSFECSCYDENFEGGTEDIKKEYFSINNSSDSKLKSLLQGCYDHTVDAEEIICEIYPVNQTKKEYFLEERCKKFFKNNTFSSKEYVDLVKNIWKENIFHEPDNSSFFITESATDSNSLIQNITKNIATYNSTLKNVSLKELSTDLLDNSSFLQPIIGLIFFIMVFSIFMFFSMKKRKVNKKRRQKEDRIELIELDEMRNTSCYYIEVESDFKV